MTSAVVGAGFAGLMAATELRRAGQDVVVLEARRRVGGRVWSEELVPGDPRTVVERGAEFVLAGYDVMQRELAACGLGLADTGMSYYVREPRGVATTHAQVAECAAVVATALHGVPDGTSLAQLLADVAPEVDAAALAAFRSRLEVTNAAPAEWLDARAAEDIALVFEAKPSHRVVGGNQRLADAMAERLGTSVRTGVPVRRVEWGDTCRVVTDDGDLTVDHVVVATPMAVTRELTFDPPLPDWKREVWARAGVGQAGKIHIPILGAETTASAVQNVPDHFWTWTATDGSGQVQPVLHGFAGSVPALERLEVSRGAERWAAMAAALRPELSLDVDRAEVTSWADDPWAREAYTALTVGTRDEDEELLQRPVGPLHFAGEHTAGSWSGLMEGALRSGVRVADELLSR